MDSSSGSFLFGLVLLAAGVPHSDAVKAPAAPAGSAAATEASATAVRVTLETIAVDRRGTWSVGSDVAEIFPGATGVMKKSATLIGREGASPPREMAELTARITPSLQGSSVCTLRIDAETRRVVSGARAAAGAAAPDRTSSAVSLKPGESRLVEVYSSSLTGARLALKVECDGAPGADGSELRFIGLSLSVSRADDDDQDLKPLKSNLLRSAIGREASDLASFNVPLPEGKDGDKRYRKEELETILSPVLVSGGRIQLEIRLRGELSTVSATAPAVTHPIDRSEATVLSSGEPHTIDVEIRSSAPDEGWSLVRYRFEVVARF